jgi:hypothetical protein
MLPTIPNGIHGLNGLKARSDRDNGVKAFTKLSPGCAFPVTVTEFVPKDRMTWSGGIPFGLFKGVRRFNLSPSGDGSVVFTVREEFTGPPVIVVGTFLTRHDETVRGLRGEIESPARVCA